ncbi:MAG: phosphoenolpyruvate--protein phosphotransferase [Erysipelotrichaceae bacterium]|nr:phosphoenolpyruvate--protein phosphotransferase [Erysipelotrichaceae bacterium]MBR2702451.1 phosphoenolpyruvate--protein phosphotransferase [Erysipelotrichaceae bacterium]MBR2745718.1 phosphoenolpyruvate--protein phosphotransferase [Erysipelotrichaceae bacterium]
MLKGIAASSGVTIAKAYKYETPAIEIVRKDADPEVEINKFDLAVADSKHDIETIKEKATGRLSDEELAIFDAHLMVVEDPAFGDEVKNMITNDKVNAEFAVETVANMYITMFESLDDEYMKARAADIRDVTTRIKYHLVGVKPADLSLIDSECIIVAHDLTPSDTAQLDKQFVKGFATEIGGRTSHSAIMARSLEIPAVVGTKGIMETVKNGDLIVLDALKGNVIINPDEETVAKYKEKEEKYLAEVVALKAYKDMETISVDGHKITLAANIGTPDDVEGALANGAEAVGLYRTEFLYMNSQALPTEEEQFVAYKKVLEAMKEHSVVVRTLDIGGDKKLPYLPIDPEMNPFLGYRAIRLCLDRKDIFRTQLRALLRASVYGHLCIMFPMIATLDEFNEAKAMVFEEKEKLVAEGVAVADDIQIGLMIEIPAAAVLADQFAKVADFFSIGTNDLIQYSMAADRMSEKVSYLYQPFNPSLLRLIKMTIDGAHKEGKWVGMCGEMAGEPDAISVLMGLGLDEFSMSATSILRARKIANSLSYEEMKDLALKAVGCSTSSEVLDLIHSTVK